MILDSITLYNFGVFAGEITLDISPPAPTRPIVLISGLNGSGKTTLATAIRLCLHGAMLSSSTQSVKAYLRDDCPARRIALTLRFHCRHDAAVTSFEVNRAWCPGRGGHLVEQLSIRRDGVTDSSLSAHWDTFVQDILPVNVNHLVFIDGEDIAENADPHKLQHRLEQGLKRLCGLDIIDRLLSELSRAQRAALNRTLPDENTADIDQLQGRIDHINTRLDGLASPIDSLTKNTLPELERSLHSVEDEYRRAGGELRERHDSLRQQHAAAAAAEAVSKQRLLDLCTSDLPLLLIQPTLTDAASLAAQEADARDAAVLLAHLERHDNKALAHLERHTHADQPLADHMRLFYVDEREQLSRQATQPVQLDISHAGTARLSAAAAQCGKLRQQAAAALQTYHDQLVRSDTIQQQIAAVPDDDGLLGPLLARRDQLISLLAEKTAELSRLNEERTGLSAEAEQLDNQLRKLISRRTNEMLQHTAQQRYAARTEQAIESLRRFGPALSTNKLNTIASHALAYSRLLLRKDRLIEDLKIHPVSFNVSLTGQGSTDLPPSRLSFAERQMLSLALLWGMVSATGKPLPIVYDTPMSRLDSKHRELLIDHYLPHASRQVILLSTDTEVTEQALLRLNPHLGRHYRLQHNEQAASTDVRLVTGSP